MLPASPFLDTTSGHRMLAIPVPIKKTPRPAKDPKYDENIRVNARITKIAPIA